MFAAGSLTSNEQNIAVTIAENKAIETDILEIKKDQQRRSLIMAELPTIRSQLQQINQRLGNLETWRQETSLTRYTNQNARDDRKAIEKDLNDISTQVTELNEAVVKLRIKVDS